MAVVGEVSGERVGVGGARRRGVGDEQLVGHGPGAQRLLRRGQRAGLWMVQG